MRSIATVSLGGTLLEKLEAAAAAGFDGVELCEDDLVSSELSPAEARRLCADLGLRILIFQPLRCFEGVEERLFKRNLDLAKGKLDVMAGLGCELLLVCSNASADALPGRERAAAQLGILADEAAARGLKIGYEALSWGCYVRRWREALQVVEAAGRPNLGLILDSFHTLALDDDFEGLRELRGDAIAFIQLADAPRLDMSLLPWSRHHRCFPGQGALPVSRFLAAAKASGYKGPVSLEIFNDEYRVQPPRAIARDGLRSLLLLEEELAAASWDSPPHHGAEPPRIGSDGSRDPQRPRRAA